jgi:hypothetical protein
MEKKSELENTIVKKMKMGSAKPYVRSSGEELREAIGSIFIDFIIKKKEKKMSSAYKRKGK